MIRIEIAAHPVARPTRPTLSDRPLDQSKRHLSNEKT